MSSETDSIAVADAIAAFERNFPYIALALGYAEETVRVPAGLTKWQEDINGLRPFFQVLEDALRYYETRNVELAKQLADTKADLTEKLAEARGQTVAALHREPGRSNRRLTTDPAAFTGAEKDIVKRQNTYVNWRADLNRIFATDSAVFHTEFLKLQHAYGLITGDAKELLREDFATIIDNPHDEHSWKWATYRDLLRDLNKQYETLDLTRQASQDFDDLFMTNKPYQNFIAEFNRLAAKCGKTNEQKVDALSVKVSQELVDEAHHQIRTPAKTDFDGWSELYQSIYDRLESLKHINKLRGNVARTARGVQHKFNQNTAPPLTSALDEQATTAGDPMQLDAARQPRAAADQCAYCRKTGHWKADCPDKIAADAARAEGLNSYNAGRRAPTFGRGQAPVFGRGAPTQSRGTLMSRHRGSDFGRAGFYGNRGGYSPAYPRYSSFPQHRGLEHGFVEEGSIVSEDTEGTDMSTPSEDKRSGKE